MINLMPPESRQEIKFARKNTQLRKWLTFTTIGLIGIVVIIISGIWFIQQSTETQQKQVNTAREQLKNQKLEETQARVSGISDSVKLVADVLSRQVLFSELLRQIGSVMPSGTNLESLNIGAIEGGLDLSARAVDYQSATQVQVNLANPENKIFEKADIINISCSPQNNESEPNPYPCTVSIRALFAKENSFQFSSKKEVNNE